MTGLHREVEAGGKEEINVRKAFEDGVRKAFKSS
jgi:hypothetical protein